MPKIRLIALWNCERFFKLKLVFSKYIFETTPRITRATKNYLGRILSDQSQGQNLICKSGPAKKIDQNK